MAEEHSLPDGSPISRKGEEVEPLSEARRGEIIGNAALQTLIEAAALQGLAAIGGSSEEAEVLLLIDAGDQRQTTRFLDFSRGRALEAAHGVVASRRLGMDRFAIAHAGEIVIGTSRKRVLLVDAADMAMRSCVRVAQRLLLVSDGARADGPLLHLGVVPNPLDSLRKMIVECPRCAAKNRVLLSRIGKGIVRCGSCKDSLAH